MGHTNYGKSENLFQLFLERTVTTLPQHHLIHTPAFRLYASNNHLGPRNSIHSWAKVYLTHLTPYNSYNIMGDFPPCLPYI